MPIIVTCSQCQKTIRVADEFAGRQGRCPQCMAVIEVPATQPPTEDIEPPTMQLPKGQPLPPRLGRESQSIPPPPPRPGRESQSIPPLPPRRKKDDDYDAPRPSRRREEDDDDRRPSRRERDDYRDDDGYDRQPPGSWQRVGAGAGMMITESLLNIFARVGYLIILLITTTNSGRYSRGDGDTILMIAILSSLLLLMAAIFGVIGRLSTRHAPDWAVRGAGTGSLITSCIALGFLVLGTLIFIVFLIGIDGRRGRSNDDLSVIVFIVVLIAIILYYVTEIIYGRFLTHLGRATRKKSIASWGNTMVIYFSCLLGYMVLAFLLAITARSSELAIILLITYVAVDFTGTLLTVFPRLGIKHAVRSVSMRDVGINRDGGLDEDDVPERERRNRRRAREEFD